MVSPSNARWTIVGLLLAATTINYVDRQALAVAAPLIIEEFHLSALEYSWVVSAFLLAYAVMQVFAGAIVDRVGVKRGLSAAVVGWSLATVGHAAAAGLWSMAALRFVLGAFEATNFPAAMKTIAEWCTRAQRSTGVGLVSVGPGLGAVLAQPLVAALILAGGWRFAFVVVGALGLIWLIAWARYYHQPESHPHLDPDARASLLAELAGDRPHTNEVAASWRALLADRAMWGLMLSRFVVDGAFYFFVFWLPKYLVDVRGFSLAQIALFAWIPYMASDLGAVAGGLAGSALARRGWSLVSTRFAVLWLGALIVPLSLPALTVASPYWALFFISLAMFGMQVRVVAHFTLPTDLYPPRAVATAWGLTGAAGSFGGMAFTPFVGWAVDHWSYVPVFWMVVATNLLAPLILWLSVARRLAAMEARR